eukprot:TRINITY_DN16043_c0_g3_i1.p2 TRINITY_DN16043_c0_g3~~TRINITY_DN16043_c0_g3_i1.p2  ORF type:complete len:107 (+),score=3.35 TRINITY_DN16043_c0_g3_i1:100-420(+)
MAFIFSLKASLVLLVNFLNRSSGNPSFSLSPPADLMLPSTFSKPFLIASPTCSMISQSVMQLVELTLSLVFSYTAKMSYQIAKQQPEKALEDTSQLTPAAPYSAYA